MLRIRFLIHYYLSDLVFLFVVIHAVLLEFVLELGFNSSLLPGFSGVGNQKALVGVCSE